MVTALNAQLIPRQARVLDMGTGSGVGAVFAAQWAREVVALDVNETAVRCARINALLNEVDGQLQVLASDLFEAVRDQTFDVILFNPPYYRGQPQDLLDKAFHATDVVERFAVELPHYLAPQGYALLLLSSTTDEASFLRLFADNFVVKTAAQCQLPGERLTLYQLQPTPILSPPPREPFA
jgi:release factor glutamine methyltransferase